MSTVKGGTTIGLDVGHGEHKSAGLKTLCWDTVFPGCAGMFSKSTVAASDTLAPKISKDTESGERSSERARPPKEVIAYNMVTKVQATIKVSQVVGI